MCVSVFAAYDSRSTSINSINRLLCVMEYSCSIISRDKVSFLKTSPIIIYGNVCGVSVCVCVCV